ncbi:MAG: SdrD B-like domain-containing protein [Candidatus Promineifilaceae bacterium]
MKQNLVRMKESLPPRKWPSPVIKLVILLVFAVLGVSSISLVQPALAQTNTMSLRVESATDSTQIINFKYIINIDNTGTTVQRNPNPGSGCSPQDAGYPDSCNWVSVAGRANNSPILTQGDQSDFPLMNLPDGKYLISVLADGYKIDGAHFTVPLPDGTPNVVVKMQPYDLPDATIQAEVFEDNAPTNSAPDVPAERGIAGFKAHIADYIDEVTTDVYGDPLCGNNQCVSKCYVVDGGVDIGTVNPIDGDGRCPFRDELPANATTIDTNVPIGADAIIQGKVIIPNLGPNRYALSVVPPNGSPWVQTTTLEGNHDWDAWVMEGATGLDTEFVVAGEPFPATFFGYVQESNTMAPGISNTISGQALAVSAYIPPVGGIGGEAGLLGAKPKDVNPIHRLFVSLSDLNNNDQTVYMQEFDCNEGAGCPPVDFTIENVPDGDYVLGVWDEPQDYIFLEQNVSVQGGETVDLGSLSLLGWWTTIDGYVFNDLNANGKRDPGEPGMSGFPVAMRTRENALMDRGAPLVTTDANGYYWMENAYPMTQWLVLEAYADTFYVTGITYQADNQPEPTTVLGAGVDVNVHPVIGLGGRLDWGVKAYDPGTNGGIVGTVSYDTTRNELDPAYAALEDWQPSIAGLTVDLYAPVECLYDDLGNQTNAPCDAAGDYVLNPDGSYAQGQFLNQYITETWERPSGCVARNVDGNPLIHGVDEDVLPIETAENPTPPCLEAPMMGVQFGPLAADQGTPDANFGASVDGNYGFGDGCFGEGGFDPVAGTCADGSDPTTLPSNMDYLVKVEIPTEVDAYGAAAVHPDRPLYKVTREEDINVGNGDSFIPQVPPPACAGALHIVDVADGTDNYSEIIGQGYDTNGVPVGVTVPASTPTDNPTFVDIGGSIYDGQPKPLCDTKLIHLGDSKSIAPGFNFFTDVPLPGRFWGLIVDDLNFSSNPKSLAYGEKQPVPFAPVGIYDYTNRLITTVESDYNGLFDVLLPSTNRISCPTPSGVCANLYRFVGNDPGTPGNWNPNYTPQYRTISAEFEAFAGLTIPADLAPTPVAVAVQIPGLQTIQPVSCTLNDPTGTTPATNPEFFAINKPYMYTNDSARTFTLTGLGFGDTAGSVQLDSDTMTINSWSDRSIQFTVPSNGSNNPAAGPYQLKITTAGGKNTVNALTFHVINPGGGGGAYNPQVFEVGVGKSYDPADPTHNTGDPGGEFGPYEHALQDALNDAAGVAKSLVVVYPGPVDLTNPRYNGRGAYYENLVMHSPVKLQGVGPGGVYPDGTPVQGSIIDGVAFGGDTNTFLAWEELVLGLTRAGNQDIAGGQVIYVLPETAGQFGSNFKAAIDGFDIRGGDQQGIPGNVNAIFGGFPGPAEGANLDIQGGAIFANSYANYLQITNNIVENNGGSYGAIRIGTPNISTDLNSNHNVRIANNRILANGGTNLAGAIGLFGGSDSYEVAGNDICGNFSAEYGGGISHFGLSPNGSIHDNRVYFNHSYDEGAGIIIAGELATVPGALYGQPGGPQGSGAVNVFNNLIQANMAEDDGGGLRYLMAGNFPMNAYNNMIVNNVSMHEGGGVALDDAPNVRFYNNTVMNNKTTATAITSDGSPEPAGLSTGANSTQLQLTLPAGSPAFSNPLLFNDIFYNNWAGTKGINTVTGITPGDADPWDMGVAGNVGSLSPTNSILQPSTHPGVIAAVSNSSADPAVVSTLDIPLSFTSWRTNVNFVGAIMVTADLPPNLLGDYHLQSASWAAIDHGTDIKSGVDAPLFDIDNQTRPFSFTQGGPPSTKFDIGADEYVTP